MLVLWLQIGFVLAVALVGMLATKRLPSLRLAVARVALLAALGLFVCLPWLGTRESPVVPVIWAGPAFVPLAQAAKPEAASTEKASPSTSAALAKPEPSPASSRPLDPLMAAMGIWALGVAFLSIHLGLGYGALARIRRSSKRVADPAAQEMLASQAKLARLKTPWLMESELVGVPFVAGAIHPTIFVPRGWTNTVEPEALSAVLSHELAHISNRDIRWNLLHRAVCILLWPQPLLWLMKRPMTAASEELCDQHVLNTGISEGSYANCLLNLREGLMRRPAPSMGVGAVSSKTQLSKRIEALMDSRRSRLLKLSPRSAFLLRAATIAIAIGATLIFASPARRAEQDPDIIQEPYNASVQILDQSGKPYIGKAQAFLVLRGEYNDRKFMELKVQDGKVDVDGSSMPANTYATLAVKAPGHGLQFEYLWPTFRRLNEIRLGPSVSLTGRLLLPDGKPAAELPVSVGLLVRRSGEQHIFLTLSEEFKPLAIRTKTDSDGRYRLEGLPGGTSVQILVDDPRFALLTYEQRGDTSKEQVADIRLQLGASFSGRVMRDGKPVAGLMVGVQENHSEGLGSRGDWAEAITDADGRYTLRGLGPVSYNVALGLTGKLADEVTAPAHEKILGKPGETVDGLDFDLKPGALVQGVIYGQDGQPLAKTMVGCYGPAHPNSSAWVQSVKTDSKGRYSLRVPPGDQWVYWMSGKPQSGQSITVHEGTRMQLDLHIGGAPGDGIQRYIPPPPPGDFAEAKTAKKSASFGPGQPSYGPVRLKSGAIARIAYVQDDDAGAHSIWRPDGSRASDVDVERSLDMTGFASRRELRSIFVRMDLEGVQRSDYFCLAEVPHASDWTVWQTYGETNGNRSMDMASFRAPTDLAKTDLRIGISAGPFKPYASLKPGDSSMTIAAPSDQWGVSGGPRPTVQVTIEVPASVEHDFMDFQAFDNQGNKLQNLTLSPKSEVDKETGKHTRYCVFTGAEPSDVALVRVGIRPYEWITFKGIHLYPSK